MAVEMMARNDAAYLLLRKPRTALESGLLKTIAYLRDAAPLAAITKERIKAKSWKATDGK